MSHLRGDEFHVSFTDTGLKHSADEKQSKIIHKYEVRHFNLNIFNILRPGFTVSIQHM